MISPLARLAAALGVSALLHAAVLLLMRPPSPPASSDFQMRVLIVPLERPAPPAAAPAAGTRPEAERQAEPGVQRAKPAAPRLQSADPERRRVQASITAGPISPPSAGVPRSRLADAARYVDADRLPSYPRLVAPLVASYPRAAFERRRTGVVVLQLMIGEDGRVAEALVLPGAGGEFAAAALEALRGARFAAGRTASGKDVPARAYFSVSFVIE